jgi:hypothetical protein
METTREKTIGERAPPDHRLLSTLFRWRLWRITGWIFFSSSERELLFHHGIATFQT